MLLPIEKNHFHRIKKGLSLKPSFAFLFPRVKRLLIQLKNLVTMAFGLNDDKIFASGGQDCRAEYRLDYNFWKTRNRNAYKLKQNLQIGNVEVQKKAPPNLAGLFLS